MFRSPFKSEPTDLDEAINYVYAQMRDVDIDNEEYPKRLAYVERLEQLRNATHSKRPSSDTILVVAGNLIGILVIVAYEQRHVMTSKGLGFLLKTKT